MTRSNKTNETDRSDVRRPRRLSRAALESVVGGEDLGGLGDVYYYNSFVNQDPNDTQGYVYFLRDYNYGD